MQIGFVTALQPFAVHGPHIAARRADEPGQPPAEKLSEGQAERDRANDRATNPASGGTSRAGLVNGGLVVAAQESQGSEPEKDSSGLTEEERRAVRELKQRDGEVRAHEAAHKAAGGAHAGGVSFTFQQGPDGQRYAVGGEVPIDISTVAGDPRATAQKMQQIRRAALAPADPSGPDRAIAAAATKALLQAQADIAAERSAAISGENEAGGEPQNAQTDRSETVAGPSTPGEIDNRGKAPEELLAVGHGREGHGADRSTTTIGEPVNDDASAEPSNEARPAPSAPDLPYLQQTAVNDRQSGRSLSIFA